MPHYLVSSPASGTVHLDAPNWTVALGLGFELFGVAGTLKGLACEVLPNGQVLAQDVSRGIRFVARPIIASAVDDLPEEDTEDDPVTSHTDEILVVGAEDPQTDEVWNAQALVDAPTPVDACARAVVWARQLIGAEAGAVLLPRDDGTLEFVAAGGPSGERLRGRRISSTHGLAAFCIKNAASFIIRDPYSDPRFNRDLDAGSGFQTRNVLCVPLLHKLSAIGCLQLINKHGGGFHRSHLTTAEMVAAALVERMVGR